MRAVRKRQRDLGDVAPYQEALLNAHTQAMTYKSLRDSLGASAADANERLGKALGEGQEAAVKLRAFIRSVLGSQDARLCRYGMKPYRGGPRRDAAPAGKAARG